VFSRGSKWSDEQRLTLLLFLFSFLVSGVPRVYTQTAAHTLFIAAHGAAAMPWAYLAEALCVPLAGALYIAATRRFSLRGLLVGTLASQVMVLLLLRGGLALQVPLLAGAAIVYFEIEFVLSSLLLWGLAGQLMTLRQGKRRFGGVSAGEPVAVIVCGLGTPALLRWLAPADLFLLSAAAALLGIALVLFILRRHAPVAEQQETGPDETTAAATPAWWRNRYIVCMVVLVAVGQLGYFFVDNAFYIEAGRRYADAESLAAFLGLYSAGMGAVSLVAGALVAPALLRRFGVRGGLLMLPLLLLAGALATLGSSAFGGPADLLFALVVGNKVIDQSLRYTVDKTSFVTLLQPLPGRQRLRVQAGLESIVEPLAGGVAGLLLFAMMHMLGFGAAGITAAVLAVACAWAALVAVQVRGYRRALRLALSGLGGAAPRQRRPSPQAARRALLAEVDSAARALAAWGQLQQDPRPGVEAQRRRHARTVGTCVQNCFSHLAGLAHDIDMHAVYTHYTQGGAERRSYVMELLDSLLDHGLKCRLFPLLEPQGLDEQLARFRAASLLAAPADRLER
jgi:ATP:ADP antiporter, AAA family